METEYEATFPNVDKEYIRKILKNVGAKLVKPEFMQKRSVFLLPSGHEIKGGWLRVRDEADKITMSLKVVNGTRITDQKELCLKIDNFKDAEELLERIGCKKKAYQESKRELWTMLGVEVTIDEWPFLEPYIEIEGKSESDVKKAAKRLGFDYKDALFCSVDTLYKMRYGITEDLINNKIPRIVFSGRNPFINKK